MLFKLVTEGRLFVNGDIACPRILHSNQHNRCQGICTALPTEALLIADQSIRLHGSPAMLDLSMRVFKYFCHFSLRAKAACTSTLERSSYKISPICRAVLLYERMGVKELQKTGSWRSLAECFLQLGERKQAVELYVGVANGKDLSGNLRIPQTFPAS